MGRLFLDTRLVTDYHNCLDEAHGALSQGRTLDIWLLVQPVAFNVILHSGLSLNQLRWFRGLDAQLTSRELTDEIVNNPLLYTVDENGTLVPSKNYFTGYGIQTHLNLLGKSSSGIVGLRARRNPTPIDLRLKKEYDAEDFFEPLKAKDGRLTKRRGECCLFGSHEVIKIPRHLNAEMRDHSHIGLRGPLHFAGFFDNGFEGDAVYEIRSDELADVELQDKMPITTLDFFRTQEPRRLYGNDSGSHYQGQIGPSPPKFFKPFDFKRAAKEYQMLDKSVLVQDARVFSGDGFQLVSPSDAVHLFEQIKTGFFHSRYDCEDDELIVQPIPYTIVYGPHNTAFSYVRAKDIADYGDPRLFGKHSIGLGGHVIRSDARDYISNALARELREEVTITGNCSSPHFVGTILAKDVPVDRVHLGLVYVAKTDGDVHLHEKSIISGRLVSLEVLMGDSLEYYETWSRILIPRLSELRKRYLE